MTFPPRSTLEELVGIQRPRRPPNIAADVPETVPAEAVSQPQEWDQHLESVNGPQMVLAGPGTGKTEFLARRVARLIDSGVPASAIVVLTFSRRAAAELESRINRLIERPTSGASASTFHSFAQRIVETSRAASGLSLPVLMTGPEQVRLVRELLAEEDPGRWPASFRPLLTTDTFASEVADFIMRCHERLLTPQHLTELAEQRADWRALPEFLSTYRNALTDQGRIDYAALLFDAVAHVADTDLASQFHYVIVDEYQDTSPAQARLAETVAAHHGNLTVAADPHQSIYSFRGADLTSVEQFPDRVATWEMPVQTVRLDRSFRVPGPILESAHRLVAPNANDGPDQPPIIPSDGQGSVEAYTFDQRSAEAEWIASEVERLHVGDGLRLDAMAVVVRSTRHLLPELSRALDRRGIPHDRPNTRLVDHPSIQLITDVVRFAIAPNGSGDEERAVRRLLLGPLITLPLGRERELVREHQRRAETWAETISRELPESATLSDLATEISWATAMSAVDGFWSLWDRLPHIERIVADPTRADWRAAWSSLARMLERQTERDPRVSLAEWLDNALSGEFEESPLLRFSRPEDDRLVVTTLHQAKGLEFDVVFIADAIEGVFPDARRSRALLQPQLLSPALITDPAAQTRERLAEERRLAYTATSRARRRVVWTATTAGIDEGERRPSRFILAAVNATTFEEIGPPAGPIDPGEFAPLTLLDAESRLRRMLVDPAASPVDRLAALRTLATSDHWEPQFFAGVPEPGPDTGVLPEKLRLSPSQANLYVQCPRQYVLERRLHAVESDSPYLSFGSIVHEVLELAEKEAMDNDRNHADIETARRHLADVWEREASFGTPEMNGAWLRRADQLLESAYADWPGGENRPAALELELSANVGGVDWIGRADRIDRVDGGLKIIDYKTSKSTPPKKDAANSLQLGFYVLAAAQHPTLSELGPPVGAELWYPLANRVLPFDMGNLDAVEDSLKSVAEGIRSEDWSPRVGPHCDRCSFRLVCPAWPEGRHQV